MNIIDLTGKDETECLISLCVQSYFVGKKDSVAKWIRRLARTAPAEMTKGEHAEMTGQNEIPQVMEVRLDRLQMLAIDDALGHLDGNCLLTESWYRLGLAHKAELTAGKSVILTLPACLGKMPEDFYGKAPDVPARWLPVIIRALQARRYYRLAELLTALYEAIVWGYGAELYEFDGLFDLATIAGRQRLLSRKQAMEKMHGLSPAMSNSVTSIEEAADDGN